MNKNKKRRRENTGTRHGQQIRTLFSRINRLAHCCILQQQIRTLLSRINRIARCCILHPFVSTPSCLPLPTATDTYAQLLSDDSHRHTTPPPPRKRRFYGRQTATICLPLKNVKNELFLSCRLIGVRRRRCCLFRSGRLLHGMGNRRAEEKRIIIFREKKKTRK